LTIIVFLLYLFLGDNNIIESRKRSKELKSIDNELQRHRAAVANVKTENYLSTVNTKEEREEYFRKYHYLKKENEDVFRIVYEE